MSEGTQSDTREGRFEGAVVSHPRGGARRRGDPSIGFGVFSFIV
jgi:hypothetical protein